MDKKQKLIAIIVGALVVIAIVVLCVCLIPKDSNTQEPTTPTESTGNILDGDMVPSDGGPIMEDVTDETLLKEYEELKEKLKDIYGVEPTKPYIFDNGTVQYIVKDMVSLFTFFPSTEVNKDSDGSPLKDIIMEMPNNPDKYNKVLLENTKPEIENGYVIYPFDWTYFTPELEEYNYNEGEEKYSHYENYMFKNVTEIMLVEDCFETKQDFYQICYDIMIDYLEMVPETVRRNCFATTDTGFGLDTLHKTSDVDDYSVLFDAIMNHRIIFVYKDDAGIFYRLETAFIDTDGDGEDNIIFNATISYEFDDEAKYSN